MRDSRAVAEARLKSLESEVLRGLSLVAKRRAEELRDETRATRAAIHQRRLLDARRRGAARRTPAPR
jgi:hypothetical protein